MLAPSTRTAVRLAILGATLVGPTITPAAAADPPVRWRTDYNAARQEATEKGLPLFVQVSSDNCFYCRKLDASTLTDPAIIRMLSTEFVPLKVNGSSDPALAKALKVQLYPTMVLAGPDGKIHAFVEGYVEADRLTEHMRRAATAASTADWLARDFQEATKAIAAAEYPRAVTLLRGVVQEAPQKPVGVKARQVLDDLESQAAGRLARAKEMEQRGHTLEAMDSLTDLMEKYAGTRAATDAATRMAGLADRPETRDRQRARQARDLLATAKEEFQAKRYYDCLQHCDRLAADFADTAEGKSAASLAADVKGNPERLAAACEQMNERTAAMYLTLADSWAKKNQPKEAAACLEKVMSLSPTSRHAQTAFARLTSLNGKEPTVPASFQKKPTP